MRPSNNPSRPSQSQPHPPHPPRLPLPQHLPSHRRRRHRRHRRQPCRPSAPKRSKSSPEVIIIIIIITAAVVVVVARPDLPRPMRVPSSLVTMAANWPVLTIINTSTNNNITNNNTISNNIICRTTAETVSLFVSGGRQKQFKSSQKNPRKNNFCSFFFFSKLAPKTNFYLFFF